jgi:hypothetical protein
MKSAASDPMRKDLYVAKSEHLFIFVDIVVTDIRS